MRRTVALVALVGAAGVTVVALVPAVRDAGKEVPTLWSPVSDWRPVVFVVPLFLSLVALAAGAKAPAARWLPVVAAALAAGWGALLLFQGLGSVDF